MFDTNMVLPTVAIVGKPNVGKSSLFNRLIKKRKAIVSEEPGVTRDINYETITHSGTRYSLADTGGYARKNDDLHIIIRRLNRRLINEAHLIIFTCDITHLSIEDYDIADIIRKSGKPFILVLNKADNDRLLHNYYDFFDLGLKDPLPISALHGKNIPLLKDRITEKLSNLTKGRIDLKNGNAAEIRTIDTAIVGKPNVGKSSLLNLLVEKNRSLVTPFPGTTRDTVDETIEYAGNRIKFIDTAGLRKRKKIKDSIEFYSFTRAEKAIKNSTLSILLIDACEGITNQDKKIASIIAREKRGLIIAANKWDIAKQSGINEREFIKDIYFHFPHIAFADIVTLSAKTGYNKIKLLKNIFKVYNNYYRKIKTRELNTLVTTLSLHSGAIKYGVQKKTAPPRFEFFVKNVDTKNNNFKKYIANTLRKNFHFEGVPVDVVLRKG